MKKRGFTLIEIIVSIAIIALIGVGSFVGVRYVNEKIRINKLSQITDKAIMAADVWIESNKEASNQLYSERNAVFVPLTHLVNDGLLSLDNTDLTLDNIKGEYVIKALSGEGKDTSCDEIKTVTSWDKSNPLYICTHLNSDGSTSSNISIIDPDKTSNMNKASREPYYFRGGNPNNYIKLKGSDNLYRILSIDIDDSLYLFTSGSFDNNITSSNLTTSASAYWTAWYYYSNHYSSADAFSLDYLKKVNNGPIYIDHIDYINSCQDGNDGVNACWIGTDTISKLNMASKPLGNSAIYFHGSSADFIRGPKDSSGCYSIEFTSGLYICKHSGYVDRKIVQVKLHLKSCLKITGGIGSYTDPYILENKCPST